MEDSLIKSIGVNIVSGRDRGMGRKARDGYQPPNENLATGLRLILIFACCKLSAVKFQRHEHSYVRRDYFNYGLYVL
jgi:hypothetical protein